MIRRVLPSCRDTVSPYSTLPHVFRPFLPDSLGVGMWVFVPTSLRACSSDAASLGTGG